MPPKNPVSANPPARPVVELASLRRRLAGMLYEMLLLLGVFAVFFLFPWMVFFAQMDWKAPPAWVNWAELAHVLVLFGGYFIYCWHRLSQTLAMRTWRLQVVTAEGKPLSWGLAIFRYTLAWPSVLCFGIGIFWAFFDLDRLFLHDRLAGTRVVQLPKRQA